MKKRIASLLLLMMIPRRKSKSLSPLVVKSQYNQFHTNISLNSLNKNISQVRKVIKNSLKARILKIWALSHVLLKIVLITLSFLIYHPTAANHQKKVNNILDLLQIPIKEETSLALMHIFCLHLQIHLEQTVIMTIK